MRTVEEYLIHAVEAEELSSLTDDPVHKVTIAEIAKMWRELAVQRGRFLEGEKPAR